MKKFKNIKLMLLGVLAMGSMNAFAAVGDFKTDGTYWYEVVNEAKAEVALVGYSNVADANPTSLTIKDVVSLKDDQLKDKDYTVITVKKKDGSDKNWWEQVSADKYTQTVTAASVKELIIKMRIDGGTTTDTSVGNEWIDVVTPALGAFTNLETLVVEDAYMIDQLPILNHATYPNLKSLDFGGVTNGGSAITLATGFASEQNFTKLVLPAEKLIISDFAFAYFNKDADALDIDISKAESIGVQAFFDANITNVVIGPDVTEIGNKAFEADVAKYAFIKSVTWKSNKILSPTAPNLPYVPAVFAGQENINSITISANNVNSVADNAFASIKGNLAVDLTGAVAMSSIKNAFGTGANAPQFTSLKLKDAPLKAADGKVSDVIDLTKSAASLATLELPATITSLVAGEFNGFTALSAIDMEKTTISAIPDNAFNGCTNLVNFTLPAVTTKIGDYAFYKTSLEAISIPATVTEIGKYAYAQIKLQQDVPNKWYKGVTLTFADGSNLATLGTNVFEDTNISGIVDFTKTKVKKIPANAFAKTVAAGGNYWIPSNSGYQAKNALTGVVLNAGVSVTDNAEIGANAFKNNAYLATADLNKAFLTAIGVSAFENTALTSVNLTDSKVTSISSSAFANIPTLTSATLNVETTIINVSAFEGDIALATVNFDKLTKLETIDNYAFNKAAFTELNLTNASSLATINYMAFGQNIENEFVKGKEVIKSTLTKIIFPKETADPESMDKAFADKYTNKVTNISEAAFFGANKVTAIENMKDLKITTLNQWFTKNLPLHIDLATNDAAFDELADDQIRFCPDGLKNIELPNVAWKWKGNATGISLTEISDYALQGLGISEITIPSSVTIFGGCVLQGCLELTDFNWMDCAVTNIPVISAGPSYTNVAGPGLHKYTFRGNSNLTNCYFMTTKRIASEGLTDNHFFWCSKEKLQVYVTPESLNQLVADGYTTANAKYSKLNDQLQETYEFKAAGFNSNDNYYYATYWDQTYSTWFDANEVEVFTAVVKGNQIVMVPAEVENGYYKIQSYKKGGDDNGVAIIRSKSQTVKKNLMAIEANNISTLAAGQNDLQLTTSEIPVSKLTFQFKLGRNKDTGVVGFFRIKTGTFKANTVYIQASSPARFADFIAIDGEETAIQGVEVSEDDAPVYNLQGARVNGAAQKGIYIKNGKKFIVK